MTEILKRKRLLFYMLLLLFTSSNINAQNLETYSDSLPIPPANKKMLFYLQRTIDPNTIIYEINYNSKGELNKEKPIIMYWIDYKKGGIKSSLSYGQKTFAYGIKHKLIDKQKHIYKISIVSYKNIEMHLMPNKKGNGYEVQITINNKLCSLLSILVNINGGRYLNPNVTSIELSGLEITSGNKISESIKINK